ncbi:MAG: immunoglobulin domain-containing protein [Verrucomicrobia bacterium]|nr:immunoglobulin domain-containing protein [Verrucomicrobiota bacterium]
MGFLSATAAIAQLPLIVRGPYLQSVTTSNIIVRWRTDLPTESRVRYGLTAFSPTFEVARTELVTDHSVTLPGLTPETRYFYSIAAGVQVLVSGSSYTFVTPPTVAKATRIWALGDVGTASIGSSAPHLVRNAYANYTGARATDVWLMLGDNAYYSGTDGEYQAAVFDVFQEMLRTTPVWSTIGNHETYSATPGGQMAYDSIFDHPVDGRAGGVPSGTERYYSFDHANIHFVCLDSELSSRLPGSPMLTWLEQDLASNEKDWTIAYWHSPPYSKGTHDSDAEGNLIDMRERVVPILEAYGVDLVLCGHSHNYERSFLINGHYGPSSSLQSGMVLDSGSGRTEETGAYLKATSGGEAGRGAVYVVAGSSGQTGFGSMNHPAIFRALNNLGSMVIDVNGSRLEARFLRENGVVDDHFTILKGDQAPFVVTAPQNRTVVEGASVTFSVSAGGTRPLSYQWLYQGDAIAGATNNTLVLGNVQAGQAGAYSVILSNRVGTTTSSSAQLTVNEAPVCLVPPAGLVSWWPMDGTTNDLSGGNEGLLQGAGTFEDGKVGGGLSLGGGAYLRVPSSPSLSLSNSLTVELWFKKEQSYVPNVQYVLFDKRDQVSRCNYGASVSVNFGLTAYFADASTGYQILAHPVLPTVGEFHHFAAVYSQVTPSTVEIRLYLDGAMVKSGTFSGRLANSMTSTPLAIGSAAGVSDFFVGVIDEVSIYNRALGDGEIQDIYLADASGKCQAVVLPSIVTQPVGQSVLEGTSVTLSVGTVGTKPFQYRWLKDSDVVNSATNSSLTFSSIQANEAGNYRVVVSNAAGSVTSSVAVVTVTPVPDCALASAGMVAWWGFEVAGDDYLGLNRGTLRGGATTGPGFVNQAMNLNGTTADFQIPDSPSLDQTNAYTVELWFRKDQPYVPNVQFILFDKRDLLGRCNYGASLSVNFGLTMYYIDPSLGGFVSLAHNPLPTEGEYHHFAGTYRQLTATTVELNLYLDGQKVKTGQFPGVLANTVTETPLHIGSARGVSDFFRGEIDEVALYNRALTATEVAAIYAAGSGGKCAPRVSPAILADPIGMTVTEGATTTFTVIAGGTSPLRYQWFFNGSLIPGATDSILQLGNIQMSQAGGYSVVVSNDVGVAESSVATLAVVFPPATVRIVDAQAPGGTSIEVPIILSANGNENALGFSVQFDPQVLQFSRVDPGPDAPSKMTVVANPANAAAGRVGVAAALSPGVTFNRGTQSIVKVVFAVAPALTTIGSPLTFVDNPTVKQISDREATILAGNFIGGTVTIFPTDLEGDTAPRPDGDRGVTIIDWVQMGRFVAGLSAVSSTNEFQRADSAPRSIRGNGVIGVTDWVQTGRYAAGLDPVTPVGGPLQGLAAASTIQASSSTSRTLRLLDAVALPGTTSNVPVKLLAQGNENALGFSVQFDPAKLQIIGVAPGSAAAGAIVNLNDSFVSEGRLGLVVGLPAGSVFPNGEREVAVLRFAPIGDVTGATAIEFADVPVRREISDALAEPLAVTYANAVVNFQPVGPPLSLSLTTGIVILSWPALETDEYELESAVQLNPAVWTKVTTRPIVIGGQRIVTVPVTGNQAWYRLKKP